MPLPADLTVRQVMNADPVRLAPDQPVRDALNLMNTRRVGAVVVADADDRVVGIFTERDFLPRACAGATDSRATPIREWMAPHPYTIHPDAGWEEAVASMERLRDLAVSIVHGRHDGPFGRRRLLDLLDQDVRRRAR